MLETVHSWKRKITATFPFLNCCNWKNMQTYIDTETQMALHRQVPQQVSTNGEAPAALPGEGESLSERRDLKGGCYWELPISSGVELDYLSAHRLPTQLTIKQHEQSEHDGSTYLLKPITHQSHYPEIWKLYEHIYNIPHPETSFANILLG